MVAWRGVEARRLAVRTVWTLSARSTWVRAAAATSPEAVPFPAPRTHVPLRRIVAGSGGLAVAVLSTLLSP